LFEKKFSETRNVIKDTTQLIQKIESEQKNLMETAATARDDLDSVVPHTQEQRAKLRKIMSDITSVEKRVEDSVKVIELECQEFDRLNTKH